jgi:hypothetical protein
MVRVYRTTRECISSLAGVRASVISAVEPFRPELGWPWLSLTVSAYASSAKERRPR